MAEKTMDEPMEERICRALRLVENSYYRLVLLVGPSGSGKSRFLRGVAPQFGVQVRNVNLEVSRELLNLPVMLRPVELQRVFMDLYLPDARKPDAPSVPLILDNLELLFGEDLRAKPLALLKTLSRNVTVLSSWNGAVVDNQLTYAELGHPEYQCCPCGDIQIIEVGQCKGE